VNLEYKEFPFISVFETCNNKKHENSASVVILEKVACGKKKGESRRNSFYLFFRFKTRLSSYMSSLQEKLAQVTEKDRGRPLVPLSLPMGKK